MDLLQPGCLDLSRGPPLALLGALLLLLGAPSWAQYEKYSFRGFPRTEVAPLSSTYSLALEHYEGESWRETVRLLEHSLRLHRLLRDSEAFCNRNCSLGGQEETPLDPQETWHRELLLFKRLLHTAVCLRGCKRSLPAFQVAYPSQETLQDFQRREPYQYLHYALFKTTKIEKAVSAAHTYLQKNPTHEMTLRRRPSEEEEDLLWERIEGARHQLTRSLNPAKLTPYLRQCRVIDEQDEEEVLNTYRFPTRTTQTGRLIDILRARGKRGSEALLESLEFYYPEQFSRLTGREPVQRCSMILDEEGLEGLTQFLMTEVRKQRCQGKQSLAREQQVTVRYQALQEEKVQLERRVAELQGVQQRHATMRAEQEHNLLELQRLKDENYTLALRYAQLSEEKNLALLRSRDLQLQVDQMKCHVSSLEEECSLVRKRSIKLQRDLQERSRDTERETVSGLQAENERLKASLQELQNALQAGEDHAPEAGKILMEILEQDRKEALEGQQEQSMKIQQLQSELHQAEQLRDKYLQDMEDLQLRHQSVQKDCELYRQRMNTVLAQLVEIEKERDQAIQSRDQVQRQHGQSMVEKDYYRKQVRALEEERDSTLTRLTHVQAMNGRLQGQLQRLHGDHLLWRPMLPDSLSLDRSWIHPDDFPSPEGSQSFLKSSDALGEVAWASGKELQLPPLDERSKSLDLNGSCISLDELHSPKSSDTMYEKEMNRLSTFPFPPGPGSLLRRQLEQGILSGWESLPYGSGVINADNTGKVWNTTQSSSNTSSTSLFSTSRCSDSWTDKGISSRQLIITLSGEDPPSRLQSTDGSLGSNISIVGGSHTGVYIQWVKPGSGLEKAGLSEGCRLLKLGGSGLKTVSLECCTKEVTHLYLQRCDDPAGLSFQLDKEGYQTLLKELDGGGQILGDSFYVRANMDIWDLHDTSALRVKKLEILHVVDTMFQGRLEWFCSRVDPLTQKDLDRGTIPNYSRAQQLLLIQQDPGRSGPDQKALRKNNKQNSPGQRRVKAAGNDQKPAVVQTSNGQGGKQAAPKPYSLLWPHQAQTRRPVIFSPGFLARGLIRCLLELPASSLDFDLCPSEILAEEEFIAAPGVVLARSIPPYQGECVRIRCIRDSIRKNKHCLLELGMRAAKKLIQNHIFPIVIHVPTTERNIQRLRSLLEPPGLDLPALLQKAQLEAQALSALPYAWAVLEPNAWSRTEKLVKVLRTLIFQEQPKLLWVEEEKLRGEDGENLQGQEEEL